MTEAREITVRMVPVGKARPRVVNGHAYTPDTTRSAEGLIAATWLEKYGMRRMAADVPLKMTIEVQLVRPKRSTREWPTVRPDVDNYAKLALDALNRIAYADDAQIV